MRAYDTPPRNVRALTDRLANVTGSRFTGELLRRAMACVVVGQVLPDGVVKGGAAMRIRLGARASRFSRDLDVARRGALDEFIDDLQQRPTERPWPVAGDCSGSATGSAKAGSRQKGGGPGFHFSAPSGGELPSR